MRGHVQHYGWGDPDAIPALTGKTNQGKRPWAELWMGAHPDLPSDVLVDGQWESLEQIINQCPGEVLGERVCSSFDGALPFLFKLLAAAQPLSIQVHPTKSAAEDGFENENEIGVALNAPHRNYKDKNHKPEIIAALTPFYGLRGFRPIDDIQSQLSSVPEFSFLLNELKDEEAHSVRDLYSKLMNLDARDVHERLEMLIKRLKAKHSNQPFTRDSVEYWILRSDECYSENGLHDRGLVSFYLLNLVTLQPGQAMYLPAGVLHAYLEGLGVELMANSNNVLRGGLTPKHVDVDELLKHVSFQCENVEILSLEPKPGTEHVQTFQTTAAEFELHRITGEAGQSDVDLTSNGPEILLPTDVPSNDMCRVKSERGDFGLKQGSPVLICHGVNYTLELAPGAKVFRALVP